MKKLYVIIPLIAFFLGLYFLNPLWAGNTIEDRLQRTFDKLIGQLQLVNLNIEKNQLQLQELREIQGAIDRDPQPAPVFGGLTDRSCNMTSATSTRIAEPESRIILSTSTRRAYARVGLVPNASSTVFLTFGGGVATTSTASIILHASSTFIEFGLNTPNPFTGTVQASTKQGSSTILTSECVY